MLCKPHLMLNTNTRLENNIYTWKLKCDLISEKDRKLDDYLAGKR